MQCLWVYEWPADRASARLLPVRMHDARWWAVARRTWGQTCAYISTERCSARTLRFVWRATAACVLWPYISTAFTAHRATWSFIRVKASTCSVSLCPGHWRSFKTTKSSPYLVRINAVVLLHFMLWHFRSKARGPAPRREQQKTHIWA